MKIGDTVRSAENAIVKFKKGIIKQIDSDNGNVIVELNIGGVLNEFSLAKSHVEVCQKYQIGEYVYTPRGVGKVTEYDEKGDCYRVDLEDERCNIMVAAKDVTPGDLKEVFENVKSSEQDPTGKNQHDPGAKLDAGKLRPYLVMKGFKRALNEVWSNGTFGANKYTDNGWLEVPNGQERYMDAAFRHYDKWVNKEDPNDRDTDSNTHHLGAMAWNILAVLELILKEKENT